MKGKKTFPWSEEYLNGIIEDDLAPEVKMYWAMITRAILDALHDDTTYISQEDKARAIRWIFDDCESDEEFKITFFDACEVVGLDHQRILRAFQGLFVPGISGEGRVRRVVLALRRRGRVGKRKKAPPCYGG